MPILLSEKIDLNVKKMTRDKEGYYYIMIKGSIQEEDITIVNIYALNIGAPRYIRQTLTDIKEEIDSNIIIVGDFNTPLTPMDRSSKEKINKETQILNDTLDEMDVIDFFKIFNVICIKLPVAFFVRLEQKISQYLWKHKRT